MNADLSTIKSAATAWRNMGRKFGNLRDDYQTKVRGIAKGDTWQGQSADMFFNTSSKATSHELFGAKKQAIAVGDLLDDAYRQLSSLKKAVEGVRDEAQAAGMHVNSSGRCFYKGYSTSSKEPDFDPKDALSVEMAEQSWTDAIAKAVRAVSDADTGIRLALEAVTKDNDGKGATRGFNSRAMGDVEKYEAKRAAELGTKINSGNELQPKEMTEFRRIMRDNKEDTAYSRTLLNSLGADGVVQLTNKLNDRIHGGRSDGKKEFSGLEKQLAGVVKTATTVDEKARSSDQRFLKSFLADMKKVGVKEYDLNVVDDAQANGSQQTRGYQSLATLMQQGGAYDKEFLHELADDIRSVEDPAKGGDPEIWNLYGTYADGKQIDISEGGWFKNDPLDGVLNAMSRNPEAATQYLDPSSKQGADRLDYLQNERDWKQIDRLDVSDNGKSGPAIARQDAVGNYARQGLGNALEAAMTGHVPGTPAPDTIPKHNDSQVAILEEVVTTYSEKARVDQSAIPDNLRENMAAALAYYPTDVYEILGKDGMEKSQENEVSIDREVMTRFIRGVGEDEGAMKVVQDSQSIEVAKNLDRLSRDDFSQGSDLAFGTLKEGGQVLGTLDGVRVDVLDDMANERISREEWDGKLNYHILGTPVTAIPGVGDVAQRSIDVITSDAANANIDEIESMTREKLIDLFSNDGDPGVVRMASERMNALGFQSEEKAATDGNLQELLKEGKSFYNLGLLDEKQATGEVGQRN
ncbi:DUF6571 family protein [Streptomyces oceani]|uniref:DUF6571 family protein n=1 Tax=Streptomyces oceani TaxID=1075402 RepID=UPI001112F6FE|nr:DUF6571 family protein [Streptomyces oceani]